MPLLNGKSLKTIGRNVAELRRAGYGRRQAQAIALHHAGIRPKPRPRPPAMRRDRQSGRFTGRA